jgi:archaellum component FlaC
MTEIKTISAFTSTVVRPEPQQGSGAKSSSAEGRMLDSIKQVDPEKADVLEKRLEDTRQAVSQLSAIKQSMSQTKKANAAEKIARIKEQIKMLKMMGGDPRSIARQIAQLARELSSASKEYSEGTGSSPPTPDNTLSTLNKAPAAVVSSETTPDDTSGTEADPAATEKSGATLTENSRQHEEDTRQKNSDDLQNKIVEIRQKSSVSDADREFIQEVRRLAAQLKALANQQKQRLHLTKQQAAHHDLNQTDQALANVEKSVSSIATGVMPPTVSISTFA